MSFDYTKSAATALRLLQKFGRQVTLSSFQQGAYDANTGTQASTNVDTTLQGAVFDFGPGVTTVRGELVEQGDQELLLQAGGPVPTVRDTITIGGVKYTVVSVAAINPAGTPVMYTLHLRR